MSYSIDRLIWQYRDKPNIRALIVSMMSEYDTLDEVMDQLRTRLDIDASEGVQLDGIGEIVGQPRPNTVEIDPEDTFAFDGGDPAKGFSGINRIDVGGRFVGLDVLIVGAMPDADYRVLLRAAVIGNNGLSDIDHILRYCLNLTSELGSASEGVGYVNLTFPRPISSPEAGLIRETLPLAAGIRLGYLAYTLADTDGFTMGSASFPSSDTTGGFDDVAGTGVTYAGTWAGLA